MKKALLISGSFVLVFVAAAGIYIWNGYRHFMAVETVIVDPYLTVHLGGGGNSIVLTSEDGTTALVVDTKMGSAAKNLKESVKAAGITIVDTHSHSDHSAGNDLYPNATIIAGAYDREQWESDSSGSRAPDVMLKPGEETTLRIGGETVRVRNMGRAHTMNDTVVYLETRGLLVTGDLVFLGTHPALSEKFGTSVDLWLAALDRLGTLYDIKTLVPGHGPMSDKNALAVMKEYFVSMKDAVGSREKLALLKKKYATYNSLPFISGFDRTVRFIEGGRKSGAK